MVGWGGASGGASSGGVGRLVSMLSERQKSSVEDSELDTKAVTQGEPLPHSASGFGPVDLLAVQEETERMARMHLLGLQQCLDDWSYQWQQALKDPQVAAGTVRPRKPPWGATSRVGTKSPHRPASTSPRGASKNSQSAKTDATPTQEVKSDGRWKSSVVEEAARAVRRASKSAERARIKQEQPTWRERRMRPIVESPAFHVICGLLIFANSIVIGWETDYVAVHRETSWSFIITHFLFNICFTLELALRCLSFGLASTFLYSDDRMWNHFDLFMCIISFIDFISSSSQVRGFLALRVLRVCKLLRLVRVFKLLRLMHYFTEVRKIFLLLASSMRTLLWSWLAVMFVVYICAVHFCMSAAEYLNDLDTSQLTENQKLLQEDFGRIWWSVYSLYTAITGGRNWGTFTQSLLDIHVVHALLFVGFISFVFFGVLNIVSAVFVECAMLSTQKHRDLLIEEKRAFEADHMRHMKNIFREIDINNDETLEYDELKARLVDNAQLQDYFRALDLNATDTLTLFSLLDADESGQLTIDEFCEGCMRLKGAASAFDISWLMHQERKNSKVLRKFANSTEDRLDRVMATVARLGMEISQLQAQHKSSGQDIGFALLPSPSKDSGAWQPAMWLEPDSHGMHVSA